MIQLGWECLNLAKPLKPSLRNSHNVVCTEGAGRLTPKAYIFGGRSKGGSNNHLLELNVSEPKAGWKMVEPGRSSPPPARKSSAAAQLGGNFYVFGGMSGKRLTNDLWCFNFATRTWNQKSARNAPSPRDRHSMTAMNGKLFVFGGHTDDAEFTNDLYVYDPRKNEWFQIFSNDAPTPRYEHIATSVDDMLIIGAGKCKTGGLNDIWVYTEKSNRWVKKDCSGAVPECRWGCSCISFQGRLVFFGGWNGRKCFNDVNVLDTKLWYFYEEIVINSPSPVSRTFHGASVTGDRMVVSCGRNMNRRLNDTYILNIGALKGTLGKPVPASKDKQRSQHKFLSQAKMPPPSKMARGLKRKRPRLDDFELKTTLGTGSFGRVRLVKYKPTGEYFALKMLRKTRVVEMKQENHIKWEKKILSSIRHPFIVNIEASFQSRIFLYLVLELVQGGEFFSLLRKTGTLQLPHAAFYSSQIVLIFQFLHKNKIVYRDLKPENLLINRDGYLKLTDFGFAKRLDKHPRRTWTLCGTPEYIAPEILLNKGHSFPVDWWALGILLYEMFTGNPPFVDDNPMRIYQKILDCRVDYPPDMPARAKDFISRLLQPNVSARLGNLANGALDVMKHPFFEGVNWRQVLERKVRAPYIPQVHSAWDTQHFDEYDEDSDTEQDQPLEPDPFLNDF